MHEEKLPVKLTRGEELARRSRMKLDLWRKWGKWGSERVMARVARWWQGEVGAQNLRKDVFSRNAEGNREKGERRVLVGVASDRERGSLREDLRAWLVAHPPTRHGPHSFDPEGESRNLGRRRELLACYHCF
ncbi:hypothetical protein KC19_6G120900 [Ceratodon purpureus]|uniref:Uncharacterized protein n=1 Tax=Ceratodon purpureus TaxID=3225 RepID=A0A8T0HDI9_CERPU|nr:hypothetical protein KC19_6G120900 [Ceratodon purpureus]